MLKHLLGIRNKLTDNSLFVIMNYTKTKENEMTVKELIKKLKTVDQNIIVLPWDGYRAGLTNDVKLSILQDGELVICDTVIGEEI